MKQVQQFETLEPLQQVQVIRQLQLEIDEHRKQWRIHAKMVRAKSFKLHDCIRNLNC